MLNEIENSFEQLRSTPFYYTIIEYGFRQLIIKSFPYKIVFKILETDVVIYAVYHTNRSPDKMFE